MKNKEEEKIKIYEIISEIIEKNGKIEKDDFGKQYNANTLLANMYGLEEAIMLNNIIYWIKKNKDKKRNFHDGYYWTYNTIDAYVKTFTFWSYTTIKRILNSLVKQGAIKKGNYNTNRYNHTNWYTVIEGFLLLIYDLRNDEEVQNQPIDEARITSSDEARINSSMRPEPSHHYTDIIPYIIPDIIAENQEIAKEIKKKYEVFNCS
jgi:hypothetical protein